MRHLIALAALALVVPAIAQAGDCQADGTLVIEGVTRGTQQVPRDPRSGQTDWITYSATVRNTSGGPAHFRASFNHPAIQQDFLQGRSWLLPVGARATLTIGNGVPPALADSTIRNVLRLDCD